MCIRLRPGWAHKHAYTRDDLLSKRGCKRLCQKVAICWTYMWCLLQASAFIAYPVTAFVCLRKPGAICCSTLSTCFCWSLLSHSPCPMLTQQGPSWAVWAA
jgi:hypothetical protein